MKSCGCDSTFPRANSLQLLLRPAWGRERKRCVRDDGIKLYLCLFAKDSIFNYAPHFGSNQSLSH